MPVPAPLFNPDYKTARSVQMNIGIQRELKRGVVLSVDYIRNVGTHYLLGIDENHAGDIRYFNKTGAQCQGRMPGEVRQREHLIAQRWNQQQVHLGHDPRHLQRDLAAKAIGHRLPRTTPIIR